jgi:hypothetical protein
MQFIDIPTERTTAVTDVILALFAVVCVVYLLRIGRARDLWKASVWAWAFGLLALSAALGAAAHGFVMSPKTNRLLWQPLNLALGLTVSLFVVGVVYDLWGLAASRRVLPILLGVGVAFYLVTLVIPGGFLVFIGYEALAMLFALGAYLWLAARGRLKGAWLMAAGVMVTIVAAGIQASNAVQVTVIWEFDHNGVFHLVQVIGVLVLTAGLRAALLARGN